MTLRALLCALVLALGCDDRDEPQSATDAAVSGSDETVGTFNLSLLAPNEADPEGHTALIGKIYDAPSPSQLVWEVAMEEGECQLLTPRTPFCPERCGASAVCVEDGVCRDYPKPRSAGSVRVTGVRTRSGATEFTLEPIANNYQPRAEIKLPFPAFEEGERIRLKAAGGDVGAFELEARGIAPLELTTDDFNLTPDAPFELAWAEPTKVSAARVRVKLDISHHGGATGLITCDFEDDGAAQLPAAMVAQLIELGVAGYPSVTVTRESSGSTGTRFGRVALILESKVERYVTLEGLRSCTRDVDCTSGETCRADLTCG